MENSRYNGNSEYENIFICDCFGNIKIEKRLKSDLKAKLPDANKIKNLNETDHINDDLKYLLSSIN